MATGILANGNGAHSSGPRDKVSRFFLLSILLVAYSGVTLGLILWNNGGRTSAASGPLGGEGSVGGGPSLHLGSEALKGGNPAGEDGQARGATSTQGMPILAGSDGGLVGEGSGATEDALSMADDTAEVVAVAEHAGMREAREGDGLALEQPSRQV